MADQRDAQTMREADQRVAVQDLRKWAERAIRQVDRTRAASRRMLSALLDSLAGDQYGDECYFLILASTQALSNAPRRCRSTGVADVPTSSLVDRLVLLRNVYEHWDEVLPQHVLWSESGEWHNKPWSQHRGSRKGLRSGRDLADKHPDAVLQYSSFDEQGSLAVLDGIVSLDELERDLRTAATFAQRWWQETVGEAQP